MREVLRDLLVLVVVFGLIAWAWWANDKHLKEQSEARKRSVKSVVVVVCPAKALPEVYNAADIMKAMEESCYKKMVDL